MTDTYVLNAGQTAYSSADGTFGNSQTKTSINPVIVNENLTLDELTNLTFYEIRTDNSTHSIHDDGASVFNRILPFNTTQLDVLSNAQNTTEYRLKLPAGTTLTMDANYDYFVVIYSTEDFTVANLNTHKNKLHIAKITEQVQFDSANDGIEFSPKVSHTLPVNTKFAIYKGPHKTNDTEVVAVAYGLLGNGAGDSDKRFDLYSVVQKPYFYFYDERLNNAGQLNYLTKYQLKRKFYESNSDRSEEDTSVFLTQPKAGRVIVDRSPYTYNVSLTDNLHTNDIQVNAVGNTANEINQSSFAVYSDTYTFQHHNWINCFRNGFRAQNNQTSSNDTKGPRRYIEYVSSPEKANIFPHLLDLNVFTTISKSGTYSEIRFADPNKIIDKKLKEYDSLKVRNILFEEQFTNEADAQLPGLAYYKTANVIEIRGLNSKQNLGFISGEPNYLVNASSGTNVEIIRIGNYHYKIANVSDIGSLTLDVSTQLFTQDITVSHYRHINDTSWSSGGLQDINNINGVEYYRKKWSSITGNLLVSFNLNANYTSSIELILKDREYSGNRITLSTINEDRKLIVPNNLPTSLYQPSLTNSYLDYFSGSFIVDKIIFNGSVEYMEDYIEDGQLKYVVTGRDNIHKLLGPVVNKNYLHSKDYVYSSKSPIQQVAASDVKLTDTPIGSTTATIFIGADYTGSNQDWLGNKTALYRSDGVLIGVVKNIVMSTITFYEPTRIDYVRTTHGFIYTNTNSDYLISGTSISGSTDGAKNILNASGKGIFFTGGLNTSGEELVYSAATTGDFSSGYDINDIRGISTDNPFMFRLANETTSSVTYFNQPTVSSLTNYDVVNISKNSTSNTTITIAPVSPFILARVDSNSNDTAHSNTLGMYFLNTQSLSNGGLLQLVHNKTYTAENSKKKHIIWKHENDNYGVPIYRYFDFGKGGKSSLWKTRITGNSALGFRSYNSTYANSKGSASGFARAFKFKEGFTSGNSPTIISPLLECPSIFDTTTETAFNLRYFPPDNRGTMPVLGSNWADYHMYDSSKSITQPVYSKLRQDSNGSVVEMSGSTSSTGDTNALGEITHTVGSYNYNFILPKHTYFSGMSNKNIDNFVRQMRNKLDIYTPSCTQYHIYSPCDIYSDSINNENHIGYSNSNYSFGDFNIFLEGKNSSKSNNITHNHWQGNVSKQIKFNSDYNHFPIVSASITPSSMKRFTLGRLIECGFDMWFNPIDVENPSYEPVEFDFFVNALVTRNAANSHYYNYRFSSTPYKMFRMAEKTSVRVLEDVSIDEEYITVDEGDWFVEPTWTSGRPDYLDYLFNSHGHFLGIVKSKHSSVLDGGVSGGNPHAGIFEGSADLMPYVVNLPTATGQAGISYPNVAISSTTGSGVNATVNITESGSGAISGIIIADTGNGYFAGDIITITAADLDTASGGTATYNGDLVIRIPTNVIRLYTNANAGSDANTLAGYFANTLAVAGNKGFEFNSHLRDMESIINLTNFGYNTGTNGIKTTVTGALCTMSTNNHLYSLRFTHTHPYNDVQKNFSFMTNYLGEGQKFTTKEYLPMLIQVLDRANEALTSANDTINDVDGDPVNPAVIYDEEGERSAGTYSILGGFTDKTQLVGNDNHITASAYRNYSTKHNINSYGISINRPRVYTPFFFNTLNLEVGSVGDSGASWTGYPAMTRNYHTRFTPFSQTQTISQDDVNLLNGHKEAWTSIIGGQRSTTGLTTVTANATPSGSADQQISVTSAAALGTCIGKGVAVWDNNNKPRFLGYISDDDHSANWIKIDKLKTSVAVGETLYIIEAAPYNYYHPSRLISMCALNHFVQYGANSSLNSVEYFPNNGFDFYYGAGVGPFRGGKFVLLKNLTFKGSETAEYQSGSSFRIDIADGSTYYDYSGGAGIIGNSDMCETLKNIDTTATPFNVAGGLVFRGDDEEFGTIDEKGNTISSSELKNNNQFGHYAFKPSLRIGTGGSRRELNTTVSSVNADGERTITIDFSGNNAGHNSWVTFTPNLTNYYLVSNEILNDGATDGSESTSTRLPGLHQDYKTVFKDSDTMNSNSQTIGQIGTEDTVPRYIHQILKHEVSWNNDGTQKHILTIDNANNISDPSDDSYRNKGEYRLMKFADVCTYDYSPNEIALYTMTPKYTKMPNSNELYSDIMHHNITSSVYQGNIDLVGNTSPASTNVRDGKSKAQSTGRSRHNEGFNSMYVLIDPDPESSDYTLIRDINQMVASDKRFKINEPMEMVVNDGNNKYVETVSFTQNDHLEGRGTMSLTLSETNETVGLVSFGETFTLEIPAEIDIDADTCKIGTTFNIGEEVDKIINDLFEINNIVYTSSNVTEKYMLAPNLKGGDLYNTLKFIGRFKGLEPRVIGQDILIKEIDDASDITNINIKEGESQVVLSKRNTSTFDVYNHIIVYGDGVKSEKRNSVSIKNIGIKTLEETDLTLRTVKEVNERASDLLKLHTGGTHQIELNVGLPDLEYLEVGKIITIDYPSENIPVGKYLILEINHSIGKALNLVVGYFTKGMEFRLAELISAGKKVNSNLRGDRLEGTDNFFDLVSNIQIKEIRIQVKETSTTVGSEQFLGFSTPLGFSSNLGFVGTTETTNLIYEEEL